MKIQDKPFIYSKSITQYTLPAKPQNLREESLHVHKVDFTRPFLSFKGKQVTVRTNTGSQTLFHKIKSELGKEPVLFWRKGSEQENIPKEETQRLNHFTPFGRFHGEDPVFGWEVFNNIHYAIYYKDTGKWDDNKREGYVIHPKKLAEKAVVIDKKATNQPLINVISKGIVQGKLIFEETLDAALKRPEVKNNKPIITVVKNISDSKYDIKTPKNIKGIIFLRESMGALDHQAATFRSNKIVSASVFDEKKIAELKKLEGKKVELKAFVNDIEAKEIDKITAQEVKKKKIPIPKLKIAHNSKPLISSEYESKLVGAKAYNLKRLEEANIPNIIVPKSFAIPPGFFYKALTDPTNSEYKKEKEKQEKLLEKMGNNPEKQEKTRATLTKVRRFIKKCKFNPIYKKQINDYVKKYLGISDFEKQDLMIRSAFSGEDAKGYSAAGLYRSEKTNSEEFFLHTKYVWISKWDEAPYYSRLDHQIPHKAVQPTIIVQKRIPADYTFTIYTNDIRKNNPDKIFIEMKDEDAIDPYVIIYNKETKDIEVESRIRKSRQLAFDENMNFLEKESEKQSDPLGENKKFWIPLLKKVGEAAAQIEEKFGAPQDIEGGITLAGKDPKIYVWQTRDIEL